MRRSTVLNLCLQLAFPSLTHRNEFQTLLLTRIVMSTANDPDAVTDPEGANGLCFPALLMRETR
jgi:hypothetical protein